MIGSPVVASERPWLKRIAQAGDAETLRAALRERYRAFDGLRRLAILGASDEGRRLAGLCRVKGIEIVAVADDNPAMLGQDLSGVGVRKVEDLAGFERDLPIVIASHRTLKATQRLHRMGFTRVAPFALLQTIRPSEFPPHPFCSGWLEDLSENAEAYSALAADLVDDFSRDVLDAVLGYRASCDPLVLEPVVEWDLYGPANLIRYREDEVYLDGGSYTGDSINLFIDRVHGKYDRIIGFEPDPATFRRLAANFAKEKRVEPIAAGLWSRHASLRFDDAGTRASGLSEASGGIEVPVVSIDEVLDGARATYIKMNIEGAEQEALAGAARTIARWRPKLAISAYHRAADLWQIPALVRRLDPAYQLYLRQHDGGVIETVLYALPREGG